MKICVGRTVFFVRKNSAGTAYLEAGRWQGCYWASRISRNSWTVILVLVESFRSISMIKNVQKFPHNATF